MKENNRHTGDNEKLYVDERTAFLVTEEYHPPWEETKQAEEPRSMHTVDWKGIHEVKNSAYFGLFKGEHSSRSMIEAQSPSMLQAVDTLCASGKLIGQDIFDENGKVDTIYHLNPEPTPGGIVVSQTGTYRPYPMVDDGVNRAMQGAKEQGLSTTGEPK